MIVSTKAIVLSSLKFKESSLIVKCYTEEGLKSYLIKGLLKSKKRNIKPSYFQPLTQLDLVANHNNKGLLNSIREANVSYVYQTLPYHIIKNSISFFIAEVLLNALHEEEKNPLLFTYIETSLIWLDLNDDVSNFHLLFLLNLSKYLGFYPKTESLTNDYFDLTEGCFTNKKPMAYFIEKKNLKLFKRLLGINFDVLNKLEINSKTRQIILEILIQYFEIHLAGFKKPKSLAILKSVFE